MFLGAVPHAHWGLFANSSLKLHQTCWHQEDGTEGPLLAKTEHKITGNLSCDEGQIFAINCFRGRELQSVSICFQSQWLVTQALMSLLIGTSDFVVLIFGQLFQDNSQSRPSQCQVIYFDSSRNNSWNASILLLSASSRASQDCILWHKDTSRYVVEVRRCCDKMLCRSKLELWQQHFCSCFTTWQVVPSCKTRGMYSGLHVIYRLTDRKLGLQRNCLHVN